MSIGRAIKIALVLEDMTQAELAKSIKRSKGYTNCVINNVFQPSDDFINNVLTVFNLDYQEFISLQNLKLDSIFVNEKPSLVGKKISKVIHTNKQLCLKLED